MKLIILSLLILLTASCAMKISVEEFESEVRRNSSSSNLTSSMESSVMYKGSDEEFHYFRLKPKVGFPRSVKVSKDELQLHDEFIYSDDEKKWLDYDTVK